MPKIEKEVKVSCCICSVSEVLIGNEAGFFVLFDLIFAVLKQEEMRENLK